jgi:hypothetical protein
LPLCSFFSVVAAAHVQSAAKSTATGVFTEEQAKRGKAVYNRDCASCHGTDLVSTDREVSNLTGDAFKRWNGQTVGELFEVTRETMPPREERSLDNQVHLDMVALHSSIQQSAFRQSGTETRHRNLEADRDSAAAGLADGVRPIRLNRVGG